MVVSITFHCAGKLLAVSAHSHLLSYFYVFLYVPACSIFPRARFHGWARYRTFGVNPSANQRWCYSMCLLAHRHTFPCSFCDWLSARQVPLPKFSSSEIFQCSIFSVQSRTFSCSPDHLPKPIQFANRIRQPNSPVELTSRAHQPNSSIELTSWIRQPNSPIELASRISQLN